MAELKTKPSEESAVDFLNSIQDEEKREDSFKLLEIFKEVTGEKPVMWGPSIIGFGTYHYTYASGREGDWMSTGFSPRKQKCLPQRRPPYRLQNPQKLSSRPGLKDSFPKSALPGISGGVR